MKLVIEYSYGNEECCSDYTIPIEYESAEALICDFMDKARETKNNKKRLQWYFTFCNEEFPLEVFITPSGEYPPEIYTLEEWFDLKKIMEI